MRALLGIFLLAAFSCASPTVAQQYPSKPVHLIVPFGPGGTTGIIARLVAQGLATKLGPVVVENRPGAGGNIAYEFVAKAAPDGYTLLAAHPALTINPSLYSKVGYDPVTSFAPVMLIAATPLLEGRQRTSSRVSMRRPMRARHSDEIQQPFSDGITGRCDLRDPCRVEDRKSDLALERAYARQPGRYW